MANERNLILTICTGNVCRSPMAEKLLQHALDAEAKPISDLIVVSAGVAAGYGEPPTDNSLRALNKVKLDLSRHKSQPVTTDLLDRAFAVFGMTDSHIHVLRHYYPELPERVHLFRDFIEGADNQIPDPFGGNYDEYVGCRDSMIEAIPSLVAYLKKNTSREPENIERSQALTRRSPLSTVWSHQHDTEQHHHTMQVLPYLSFLG